MFTSNPVGTQKAHRGEWSGIQGYPGRNRTAQLSIECLSSALLWLRGHLQQYPKLCRVPPISFLTRELLANPRWQEKLKHSSPAIKVLQEVCEKNSRLYEEITKIALGCHPRPFPGRVSQNFRGEQASSCHGGWLVFSGVTKALNY